MRKFCVLAVLLISACATTPDIALNEALANLHTADGISIGTVYAREDREGIRLSIAVAGLAAGERGVHVHTTGKCEAPDFASAGGHWNPGSMSHGLGGGVGQHAGDMPNLVLDAEGAGRLEYVLQGGSFAQLMDADGAAFVLHAGRDDQATDPSGNSGARVACGVFVRG